SGHPVGRFALAYCIVGYILGALRPEGRRSAFLPMLLVGFGAFLGNFLDVVIGTVFGYVHLSIIGFVTVIPVAVLYDVVLTPFVFPLVAGADRRLVPHRELLL